MRQYVRCGAEVQPLHGGGVLPALAPSQELRLSRADQEHRLQVGA